MLGGAQQLDFFPEPYHYIDTQKWGYFSVLAMPNGRRPWEGRYQHSYSLKELPYVLRYWQQSSRRDRLNTYITQAIFNKPNRRKTNFWSVGQLFVDLDVYTASSLAGRTMRQADLVQEIYRRCLVAHIPFPSVVLSSGRGYYLKWFHDALPRKALKKWEWCQQYLNALFSDLGADSNAKDASRVLRIDGSINQKNGAQVKILEIDGSEQNPSRYRFEDIARHLLPYSKEDVDDFKAKMKELHTRIASEKRARTLARKRAEKMGQLLDNRQVFSSKRRNWMAYGDIVRLAQYRYGLEGCPDGLRDPFIMYACNFFALSEYRKTDRDFWWEFQQIAQVLAPSWSAGKVRNKVSDIYRRLKETQEGKTREYAGREWIPLLTPRDSTLHDALQITQDELHLVGLDGEPLIRTVIDSKGAGAAVYKDRDRLRDEKRRRAAGAVTRSEYETQSITAQRPWERLGMSRRTWYRKGKPSPES